MVDVLCLGEPMVELNQDPAADPPLYRMGFGGDTSNCAIAVMRLGGRAGYWTRLGCDAFGDALADLWRREGVAADAVIRDPDAATGAYVVTHGPDGHRFSYLRAGSAASRMVPADLPRDFAIGLRLLHVSAISQGISESACDTVFAAIDQAKAAGAQVAYDTNLRLQLWPVARARAIIEATAAMADVLLPGMDDAKALTGLDQPDAICDHYLRRGAGVVALTLGGAGALVASAAGRVRVAPIAVDVVDATGAGDTFDGAFLVRFLETGDPVAAGQFANVAAALSTQGFGAVAPIPTRAAVDARLASSQTK
ncbi:MAG: sugar kinase [Pseudomonadota bacterium]